MGRRTDSHRPPATPIWWDDRGGGAAPAHRPADEADPSIASERPHSAMAGALETTRSLVIVGAPTVDAAELASRTLDWLSARGFDHLVSNAVVALSFDRYSRDVDRDAVVEHFTSCCRAVVEIPADRHLAIGGHLKLDHLQPATLDAALTLAAHVAVEFPAFSGPPVGDHLARGARR